MTASVSVTDALWQRYRATGDPVARARLLDQYLGLVHHCARELAERVPPSVELDDLIGAGSLGLVKALESFDLERGLAFSTYAMRRIRGAMLDELRARDWRPRSVRARQRQMNATAAELQARLGRPATTREMAAALGVDQVTYSRWRDDADGGTTVSFDAAASDDSALTLEETIADPATPDPTEGMRQAETGAWLKEAIANLPERERLVLSLYYYEQLNLRQIAEVMHVTESRISQVRTSALRQLRRLAAQQEVGP